MKVLQNTSSEMKVVLAVIAIYIGACAAGKMFVTLKSIALGVPLLLKFRYIDWKLSSCFAYTVIVLGILNKSELPYYTPHWMQVVFLDVHFLTDVLLEGVGELKREQCVRACVLFERNETWRYFAPRARAVCILNSNKSNILSVPR